MSEETPGPRGPRSGSPTAAAASGAGPKDPVMVWIEDMWYLTKAFILEMGSYTIFIALFIVVVIGARGSWTFFQTDQVSNQFPQAQFLDITYSKTFLDLNNLSDFWEYFMLTFPFKMYQSQWYNGDPFVGVNENALVNEQLVLLGGVRVRQVRVAASSCDITTQMATVSPTCYPPLSPTNEAMGSFQTNGLLPDSSPYLQWHSSAELGEISWYGFLGLYPGSGYVAELPGGNSSVAANEIIQTLFQARWLDRASRIVMIDFTVFCPNVNLFSVVRLSSEFPATAGSYPLAPIRTFPLIRYVSISDYTVLGLEVLFVLLIVYYTVEECLEIWVSKANYLKDFWNYVEWVNLLLLYGGIGLRITTIYVVSYTNMAPAWNEFVSFQYVANLVALEQDVLALCGFLVFFKIFKFLQIFPRVALLMLTLQTASVDLASFFIMFFILFFGFSLSYFVVFGRDIYDFSSVPLSMLSLFNTILGNFDVNQLQQDNRILGPLFFILFELLVFFVLVNIFVAILNNAFSAVTEKLEDLEKESIGGAIFGFLRNRLERWRRRRMLKEKQEREFEEGGPDPNDKGSGGGASMQPTSAQRRQVSTDRKISNDANGDDNDDDRDEDENDGGDDDDDDNNNNNNNGNGNGNGNGMGGKAGGLREEDLIEQREREQTLQMLSAMLPPAYGGSAAVPPTHRLLGQRSSHLPGRGAGADEAEGEYGTAGPGGRQPLLLPPTDAAVATDRSENVAVRGQLDTRRRDTAEAIAAVLELVNRASARVATINGRVKGVRARQAQQGLAGAAPRPAAAAAAAAGVAVPPVRSSLSSSRLLVAPSWREPSDQMLQRPPANPLLPSRSPTVSPVSSPSSAVADGRPSRPGPSGSGGSSGVFQDPTATSNPLRRYS